MSFWRGETLTARLSSLIDPFDADQIDCNAYTLRIGAEAFVTSPDGDDNPKNRIKLKLNEGDGFRIPPGQFAFIATEESVAVPSDAMAFISMKTTHKLQGLINVSGFHVDPGWKGNLLFGVYNAGASSVHLHRGQDMFLIWYASLNDSTTYLYQNKKNRGGPEIPDELITGMSGDVFSPMRLARDIREMRKDVQTDLNSLKSRVSTLDRLVLTVGGGLIATFVATIFAVILAVSRESTIPVQILATPLSTTLPETAPERDIDNAGDQTRASEQSSTAQEEQVVPQD